MRKILFTTLLVFNICVAKAQVNIDSLKKALISLSDDTADIQKIIDIGKGYKKLDLEIALIVFKIAEQKAEQNKDERKLSVVYLNIANVHTQLSNSKEAVDYYVKSRIKATNLNDKTLLGEILQGTGVMYYSNKVYDKALTSFEEALLVCKEDDLILKSSLLGNMGGIYYALSAKEDTTQSGHVKYDKQLLAKAIGYNLQSFKIAQQLKNAKKQISQSNNLCLEYIDLEKLDSASFYLDIAKQLIDKENNPVALTAYYSNEGKLLRAQKKYLQAIGSFKSSVKAGEELNMPQWIYDGYLSIAETYETMGDYKNSLHFYNKYISVRDTAISKENFAAAADIQNKYENEKKEKELIQLNTTNKEKSTLNKIFIGSTIGVSLLGFLGFRNFRGRQKIQQQKITELEKDKQLSAIDAMLQGQEEERSRIAKDLHDGLGGMLSGTKLSFINMKENLVLTPENATQFDKSLSMLDNTIADLRKVAHNLMPEALVKFGLQEAVRDFCNSIQSSSNLKVVYQPLGVQNKLSNTAEVFTYRIIQELVNNAVKHANATQIIVQLTTNNNKVGIAVEDDGKGFDVNALANSKGAGMDNIKYRVQYFNGTIDTVTSAGNGTSINILLNT
jgi:two-component system, NarL family, sensor kinase